MTNLVDVADVPGNLEQVEKDLAEASLARASGVTTETNVQRNADVADKLPTKFKGKSAEEIAEMYLNLESQYGRTANDLGVQRKLTDRLLDLKRDTDLSKNSPARVEISAVELLDKPTEAIDRYVTARENALLGRIDERINRLEGTTAQSAFLGKHPDYEQVAHSDDFVQWVQSSNIRKRAATTAYNGDWNVADELISEYKAAKPSKATAEANAKRESQNLQSARNASLDSGASAESPSKSGGKVYRRADLMKLRIDKPDVYYDDSFQAEILQAYADGRVK